MEPEEVEADFVAREELVGITLVTGMIIGSIFTLFVVPSIYVLVARTRRRAEETQAQPAGELEPATV